MFRMKGLLIGLSLVMLGTIGDLAVGRTHTASFPAWHDQGGMHSRIGTARSMMQYGSVSMYSMWMIRSRSNGSGTMGGIFSSR